MKKTAYLIIALLIAAAPAGRAFAAIKIFDFSFEDTVVSAGKTYYVDMISEGPNTSGSVQMTNGTYDAKAWLGFYGTAADMDSDDFADNVEDKTVVKIREKGSGTYIGEMGTSQSASPTSVSGYSGKVSFQGLLSHLDAGFINPGNYTVDAFLGGKIITTVDLCLPTFTSSVGKSVGNVTCPGKTPSTAGPVTATPPATNPPAAQNPTSSTTTVANAPAAGTPSAAPANSAPATTTVPGPGSASTTTNPVTLTPGNTDPVADPACLGPDGRPLPGCYALYGGLAEALGERAALDTREGVGGIANSLVALATGAGGVLAVAMLMYEGFLYMRGKGEGNAAGVATTKGRIASTVLGFLLLLSAYAVLRTVNPELLDLTPRLDAATLTIEPRAEDPDFVKNIESIDDSGITLPPGDYSDESFLTYLAHQQGSGGAAAILWSAKQGKSAVPNSTPFTKGDIQKNIGTNCPPGCSKTPAGFADYWRKKVAAAKAKGATGIPQEIDDAIKKASTERHTDLATMRAMCRIESHTGCTTMAAVSKVNGYGYAGLFQLSNARYQKVLGVWETYRKNADAALLDAYDNAYAAAGYMKANLLQMKNYWQKINQ